MLTPAARLFGLVLFCAATAVAAQAQVFMQPTPPPAVTAENEPWYLSGGPISFNGNVYYPAGAVTHFDRNAMVRTGIFDRTPIYIRPTQEPGSVIYVPLPGGLMRPYERRRSGDLAGTSGSSAPSFRVVLPSEEASQTVGLQAPSPPTGVPVGTAGMVRVISEPPPTPAPVAPAAQPLPVPVGTTGVLPLFAAPARTRVQTVQRPVGLNDVYLQYQDARWFAAGPAVEFAADRFTRIGEHRGFAVYQEKGRPDTIYVSLLAGSPGLVTPYQRR